MLITVRDLRTFWGLQPRTLLHVGAHYAEELQAYTENGWGSQGTWWVEAQERATEFVRDRVADLKNHYVLNVLAWDQADVILQFHRTNNGQSSSALELGTHTTHHPEIHVTETLELRASRLDNVWKQHQFPPVEFINLDVQGAEQHALEGFGHLLDHVDAVYCEVNTEEVYKGLMPLDEFDARMLARGFARVDWELTPFGWGDALYLRRTISIRGRRLRRRIRRGRQQIIRTQRTVIGLIARVQRRASRLFA